VLSAAGEIKTTQKIFKVSFSWIEDILDFTFWQRKKLLQ
jgi:hypothetical protein